jgi:MraZ protein
MVPSTFRSALATNRNPTVLITFPSFRLPAIECSGSDRMKAMQDRLDTLDQLSDEHGIMALLFADAHSLAIDTDGRIVLSETLKEHAGITADVAFVGLGAMFQMWEPARYAERHATVREHARRSVTTLPAHDGPPRQPAR